MAFICGRSRLVFRPLAILLCLVTLAALSGCAGVNLEKIHFSKIFASKPSPTVNKTAKQLLDMGTANLARSRYTAAAKDFRTLKDKYPYSKYATLASLKLGDAYFGNQNYVEAAMAYSEFARLHPSNKNAPYVLYQAGMSHFLMFTNIDRETSETVAAMKIFNTLIGNYPGSEYATMAQKQLIECKKRLAGHEFGVAKQYYISGDYCAAKGRLVSLKRKYPQAIVELGYGPQVNRMLATCCKQVAKGPRKPSIWVRLGF